MSTNENETAAPDLDALMKAVSERMAKTGESRRSALAHCKSTFAKLYGADYTRQLFLNASAIKYPQGLPL